MIGRERRPGRLPAPALRALLHGMGRLVANERVPVERQRARLEALSSRLPLPVGTTVREQATGGVPGVRVAADARPTGTVLYLHGGGFRIGSSATARGFAARLAAAVGAEVVVPDYRLAPEHPYPAALDDVEAVWNALSADAGEVAVVGDSAGGGLAVALAMRLRDAGRPPPCALVLLSPWLDLAADRAGDPHLARRDPMLDPVWLAGCARDYAADRPLTDPAVSPLHGSPAGLPPTQVIAGADDLLISDADRFVRAAHDAGVEVAYIRVPGLWHVYPTQAGVLAEADRALDHLTAFVADARRRAAPATRREAPGA